jgi:hypothetical protein
MPGPPDLEPSAEDGRDRGGPRIIRTVTDWARGTNAMSDSESGRAERLEEENAALQAEVDGLRARDDAARRERRGGAEGLPLASWSS